MAHAGLGQGLKKGTFTKSFLNCGQNKHTKKSPTQSQFLRTVSSPGNSPWHDYQSGPGLMISLVVISPCCFCCLFLNFIQPTVRAIGAVACFLDYTMITPYKPGTAPNTSCMVCAWNWKKVSPMLQSMGGLSDNLGVCKFPHACVDFKEHKVKEKKSLYGKTPHLKFHSSQLYFLVHQSL